jgi:short-subunit dehydrogenase
LSTTWPWARALVTGASSGIGESIARQLAEGGVDLVLVARSANVLEELATELRTAHGVDVEVLVADLIDDADVERTAARLADEARPIDLLVNNAGFGSGGPFAEASVDQQSDMVRLNMLTVLRLAHAAGASLARQGKGSILNVSSVGSLQPIPEMATYSASKAFVTNFSESLHEELRGRGVTVTAVLPGLTKTKFVEKEDFEGTRFPAAFWSSAEDVAADALRAAARGDAIAVPGVHNKAMMLLMDRFPRGMRRRLSDVLYRMVGPGTA